MDGAEMSDQSTLSGIVHGKMIELDRDTGLPEGQRVSIVVRPWSNLGAPGEGLKRSFGGWSEDALEIDEFLRWNRQQRKKSRSGD